MGVRGHADTWIRTLPRGWGGAYGCGGSGACIAHGWTSGVGMEVGAPLVKRYPEPMAHGLEACEPSHPLWPMAQRPVSRHTCAEAVDTGCQRDIPVL